MAKKGQGIEDMSAPAREALERNQYKPGQSGNPEGINGWSKMRERYRILLDADLEDLSKELIRLALDGDVPALALALKPILNVSAIELTGTDGAPINFIELARKAQAEAKDE